MKARTAIAAIIGALALAGQAQAVTLVTPQGAPVGGKWQRWADRSRITTIAGPLTFEAPSQLCVGYGPNVPTPPGCSVAPRYGQPGYAIAASSRDSLYFELGHQFDYHYLTVSDRRYLAHFWSTPHARWTDSAAGLRQAAEDGLEADFAAAYADCAEGTEAIGGLAVWEPPNATVEAPTIYPRTDAGTCQFIRRVARRH